MMKKIIALFILIMLTIPVSYARVGQPSFVFAINENPVASSSSPERKESGLSGGAVTAITLGSIGGAALLGLGGWLYKRKTAQCLTAGCIRGSVEPLLPFCIEQNPNSEFYARINNNYPYLKKALSLNEIHYCPHSKYLLVYDTSIEKRVFDSVKFNLPAGVKSIKITHVTDAFKNGDFTAELYLNRKFKTTDNQTESDILAGIKNETDIDGVIMKTVSIDTSQYESAVYVISNYSSKRIYAIVFEFIF